MNNSCNIKVPFLPPPQRFVLRCFTFPILIFIKFIFSILFNGNFRRKLKSFGIFKCKSPFYRWWGFAMMTMVETPEWTVNWRQWEELAVAVGVVTLMVSPWLRWVRFPDDDDDGANYTGGLPTYDTYYLRRRYCCATVHYVYVFI